MRCEACGFELPDRAKFCSECGEPVARPETSPASAVERIPLSAPADGERRQITVLFCDLIGSTALASRLDPEDWRDVLGAYQQAATQVVERFDGYVAQYLGDGILVYFGYPVAHEDDALRATRAALGITESIAALTPRLAETRSVAIGVRVGIHTGTVVVGEVGGSTSRKETLALGGATNVAARLQELAEPNTVILSNATFRLVRGHFVTEALGTHSIRGLDRPVEIYRAVRPVRVKSTLDPRSATAQGPLLGREQEIRLLVDRWDLARNGKGQAVLVSGDAGIGKSRLLLAFRKTLLEQPHTWLETRGSMDTQNSPLYPIISLQTDALGLDSFDSATQKVAQLERSLEQLGLDTSDLLPLFASLHSLPLPPRYSEPSLSPEAHRRRLLGALVEWLVALASEQPLVAVFEDAHWLDPTTQEVLGKLLEATASRRLLLAVSYRAEFRPPWPSASHVTPILLSRLTRADAAALARSMSAGGGRVPEALVRDIVQKSDGVPLFVEELTRTVLQTEGADRSGEVPFEVPATLKDSLMARLDQLGSAKEVAQLCAAIGREFSFELLRAVSALDEPELEAALDLLLGAQLLIRSDHRTLQFKHALIQEQGYDSLLKATRQQYHRQIAEALSTNFPDIVSSQPELLAHHFTEGGLAERAVGYWLQAGQRSIARSANIEASRQLSRGLEGLGALPESRERDQQELLMQSMLGVALISSRGYASPEVERSFERARKICQKLGETPHLFPVLFGLCLFYLVRSDERTTDQLIAQLQSISSSVGDPELVLEAHSAAGAAEFWKGNFAQAEQHILKARVLYDPQKHGHHAFIYGQDPLAYGYIYGALTSWFLGYPEQAVQSAEHAVLLAEKANHPLTLAGVLSFCADLYHHLRDRESFERYAERTINVAEQQALPMWSSSGLTLRGTARFASGDQQAGIALIQDGLEQFRMTGAKTNTAYLVSRLVEAYLAAGDIDRGLDRVDEAIEMTERELDRYYAAELWRLKGELLRRAPGSTFDAVHSSLEKSLQLSRAQGARALELRAATSLARVLDAHGSRREARDLLDAAYRGFTEGFENPDLCDAKALLDMLDRKS